MLRFGIICRDMTLAAWQRRTAAHLRATDAAQAALRVLDEGGITTRTWVGDVEMVRIFLAQEAQRFAWWGVAGRPAGLALRPWCVRPVLGRGIAAIRAQNLDFIVDFGPGPVSGAIARLPRYGVWSFAFNGNDQKGPSPPCFWAVSSGKPTVAGALHRHGGDDETDTIVRQGHFKNVTYSYRQTLEQIGIGIAQWPAQVCEEIRRGVTNHA